MGPFLARLFARFLIGIRQELIYLAFRVTHGLNNNPAVVSQKVSV